MKTNHLFKGTNSYHRPKEANMYHRPLNLYASVCMGKALVKGFASLTGPESLRNRWFFFFNYNFKIRMLIMVGLKVWCNHVIIFFISHSSGVPWFYRHCFEDDLWTKSTGKQEMTDTFNCLCQSHGYHEFCMSSMKKGKPDTFTHVAWGTRGLEKILLLWLVLWSRN